MKPQDLVPYVLAKRSQPLLQAGEVATRSQLNTLLQWIAAISLKILKSSINEPAKFPINQVAEVIRKTA